ncbi:MAG: hypothetical protein LBS46_00040 [Dysgonamonadaceae bacterium]|jgi:hypothetical protein|nr:hypothetical protein [Dysgonamonadaceae bacterium]
MKYCKIDFKGIFGNGQPVLGHANGEFVPNGKAYFDRMGKGEIIEDAPIFDYFYLKSYGSKEDWEWRLQDIHGGIGVYPRGADWYISDDFKVLLENFKIAPKYHFYETRLLYKGKKLKYWIFQFPMTPLQNYNYEQSHFYYENENNKVVISINDEQEFQFKRGELLLVHDIRLQCSKITIKENYDLIYVLPWGDKIISQNLKKAIEDAGLQGFIFSELDYEVVVENEK